MKKLFALIPLICLVTTTLFGQQKDSRTRTYLTPTRIVWTECDGNIKDKNVLLKEGTGQPDLTNSEKCVITSTSDSHPALLFDFGKEIQGGIQIVTGMPADKKPIKIRVRFGESVSEAMCDIDGENGASNDHAIRDFEMLLPWLGVAEIGNSGFRFARIDLVDDNRELQIKEIRAISTYRDIPYLGSFVCDDPRLNDIWRVGAYTVHLNMQEYLWDGIKRDRLVWLGDMHPEVMTINNVFGYNEVVPKSLDIIRDMTPLPNWMNGIPTYSICWIMIQRDWYFYHGDLDYLKQQQPYLKQLLQTLISKIDANGQEQLDGFRFVDWPSSPNKTAIDCGLQALMIRAMKDGGELCAILGDDEMAQTCQNQIKKMDKATKKLMKMVLKSDLSPDTPGQKQAASLLALTDLIPAKEANDKIISYNGAHGYSTFYGYYMLQAKAKAGDYQGAMDDIKQYWGAMLDLGATTFWEDFNLKWLPNAGRIDELPSEGKVDVHKTYGDHCYQGYRHSFCHGWASGPTSWLTEHVLGVQVVEPGCKTVKIEPHLGNLNKVEGTFPTPYGVISIKHQKDASGNVKTTVDAPKEVKIIYSK